METDEAFRYLLYLNQIIVNPLNATIVTEAVIVVFLLICSAFISGSEVAFFSLTPSNIEEFSTRKSKQSDNILKLLLIPDRLLSTILVVNNFVNVGIVILSAYISSHLFDFTNVPLLGFVLEVVVITFLLLLFGEILPKVYASRNNVRFVMLMAGPLLILDRFFRPLSTMLLRLTRVFRKKKHRTYISKDELSDAISIASGENKDDEKILKGIVKFGDIAVVEIMKPRIDVVAIDIATPFNEVMPLIIDSGYSRIPVYSGSFDKVQGVLYIKDLLPHFHKPNSFNWQSLIRPPYFVPEPKRINEMLEEFQKKKIHMAIVIDEYGGTSGIITLEDILEEIVGEIPDEFDQQDIQYSKISESEYIFKGKTQLNDFFKVMEIEHDPFEGVRGESDTLAGLILEIAGTIPDAGFTLEYASFRFRIEEADKRRIKQIRVEIIKKKAGNERKA